MAVVEFPRVRVSKALSERQFSRVAASQRPRGRALLVGGPSWLEAARRAILETETKGEATWYEAWDFAEATSFLTACRVDVVLIATDATDGPDWLAFHARFAALRPRPLLLGLSRETGAEALQRLLDQGVDGVVSLDAVRMMRDELRLTLSHTLRRRALGFC